MNDPVTDVTGNFWEQVDMSTEFGDTIQYSPWTDDKARLWSNNGPDPSRTNFSTGAWFDINIVINEENWFRTWSDVIASSNATLDTHASTYAYDGTRDSFPEGFRVLVTSNSPTGDLANFANMVVEWQRVNPTRAAGGQWVKLYTFDTANTKIQVANLDDGKIYEDTITAGPTHSWQSIPGKGSTDGTSEYGNDCFHPYTTAPANANGIDLVHDPAGADYRPRSEVTDSTERPDITSDGSQFAKNIDSAVTFTSNAGSIASDVLAGFTGQTSDFFKHGIGFNFRLPWPCASGSGVGSPAENVGELYGGGATEGDWATTTSYSVGDTVHESTKLYICLVAHTSGTFATDLSNGNWRLLTGFQPSSLDVQNQNYTHDGQQGYNALNSSSEDLGQLNALGIWLNFSVTSGGAELNDEHRFRAWMIDRRDNVVYQDFVVRFSNNWEDIVLPISGFRIYKGRKPLYGFDVIKASFVPPKELEVINIFEWRHVKLMGVQYQPNYDKFGRYNPVKATVDEGGNSVTWGNLAGATYTLKMDGFRFIKPLLVTSGVVSDRNLEPDFQQWPNITVYDQLLNVAKSHLEIEKFKHKEFIVESSGDEIFDIPFGDAFFLKNEDIVSDDDKSGEDNNIKLVAKRIEYSITKPDGGNGGLRRRIQGSKVFT